MELLWIVDALDYIGETDCGVEVVVVEWELEVVGGYQGGPRFVGFLGVGGRREG